MTANSAHHADVVVIGGGPAGSTAATMLARQGYQVVLFERESFPRAHIGESLLPASMPILEALAVMPAVQAAGFLPKWGATMVWGTSPEPWSWYFRETNREYPHSYQVWRPQFDQILLENSRAAGVDVREGHRVIEVLFALTPGPSPDFAGEGSEATERDSEFGHGGHQRGLTPGPSPTAAGEAREATERDSDIGHGGRQRAVNPGPSPTAAGEGKRDRRRATGVRVLTSDGIQERWDARYVVDASGQAGVLGRALRLRRPDEQFRNLAIFAYFEGAERLPAPDETNILIESYAGGWTWVIPLHTGWTSVGFVMDSKAGQEAIARDGLELAYQRQIDATGRTRSMLANARQVDGPTVIRDWSYVSEHVAGDGYVLAGDAACFIDPLFSTGVHLALSSGLMAAALVTSALKDLAMAGPAGRVYQDLYYQQYGLFRELARLFYASNRTVDSYFWEARRIIGADEDMAPREAFIRAAAGQPPRGYERVVIEQGVAPQGVIEGVRAVEHERGARQAWIAGLGQGGIADRVPVVLSGTCVRGQPVLGEGEFVWGHVVSAPGRADVPVSAAVAALVGAIDGSATVESLATRVAGQATPEQVARFSKMAASALGILYVDGIITELRET